MTNPYNTFLAAFAESLQKKGKITEGRLIKASRTEPTRLPAFKKLTWEIWFLPKDGKKTKICSHHENINAASESSIQETEQRLMAATMRQLLEYYDI